MGAIVGVGTVLKVDVSGTMTAIGQIEMTTPPGITKTAIPTDDISSTWSTFLGGKNKPGTLSFVLNWDTANTVHGNLWDYAKSTSLKDWSITLSNSYDITFEGIITEWQPQQLSGDSILKVNVTIQVSGEITIAS